MRNYAGWTKEHRTITCPLSSDGTENPLHGDCCLYAMFRFAILHANYTLTGVIPKGWDKPLIVGEVLTSDAELGRWTGETRKKIRTRLRKGQAKGLWEVLRKGQVGTRIIICNYRRYQGDCDIEGQAIGRKEVPGVGKERAISEEIKNKKEKVNKKKNPDDKKPITPKQKLVQDRNKFLKIWKTKYIENKGCEYVKGQWDTKTCDHIIKSTDVDDRPLLIDFYLKHQAKNYTDAYHSLNLLGSDLTRLMGQMKSKPAKRYTSQNQFTEDDLK